METENINKIKSESYDLIVQMEQHKQQIQELQKKLQEKSITINKLESVNKKEEAQKHGVTNRFSR